MANYKNAVVRIIDANFNRAKEGLRVCEDIMRLCANNKKQTLRLRNIRHALSTIIASSSPMKKLQIVAHRDIAADFGKKFNRKPKKKSIAEIFCANAQRSKEALRVLEETSCLFDTRAAQEFQRLRFRMYTTEQESLKIMRP